MFGNAGTLGRLSSLGADEPSLLAFAPRNDGIHTDEENNLRLIVASSRCPFRAKDGVLLNVECFGPLYRGHADGDAQESVNTTQNNHNTFRRSIHNADEWPILLYVHGICESAETWGVQTLAQQCAKHCWRLVVLELAGHGLSGDIGSGVCRGVGGVGSVGGKGRAVCPDFDELVDHVVEFTAHVSSLFSRSRGFVLAGGSLGGALVAYAVKEILSERKENSMMSSDANINDQPTTVQQKECPDFYGVALLAPALGILPDAIPPTPVVMALKTLSYLLPSHGILTPVEQPAAYACPPSSTRNYSGRWPLSTSNMLLNITSHRIPNDVKENNVQNQMGGLPSLLVITGDRDEIVPVQDVKSWYDAVTNLSEESNGEKTMIVLRGAGHGFFHDRSSRGRKQQKVYIDSLFEWLNDHARIDFG